LIEKKNHWSIVGVKSWGAFTKKITERGSSHIRKRDFILRKKIKLVVIPSRNKKKEKVKGTKKMMGKHGSYG